LLSNLFNKHLIADAEEYQQDIQRVFLDKGAMSPTMNRHKLQLVTGEARVEDLLKELSSIQGANVDATVQHCATGNKNYINWVKQHTDPDEKIAEQSVKPIVDENPTFNDNKDKK
jgi:hypothetical protein